MARVPIEIATVSDMPDVDVALEMCNSVQDDYRFLRLEPSLEGQFRLMDFRDIDGDSAIELAEDIRTGFRGYHPFLIVVFRGVLRGAGWTNLFNYSSNTDGLALLTSAHVEGVVVPTGHLSSYFIYYFARLALHFGAPDKFNHEETRHCVYDYMEEKRDLLLSMRSGALCDECRQDLLSEESTISPPQLASLDRLLATAGRRLDQPLPEPPKRRMFVGSSSEGLEVARAVQAELGDTFDVEVWNQGTVFGLGDSTIEALERAARSYDFGVFVFTPDDELSARGSLLTVARDNVLFELGLFCGALSRHRAFVVRPRSGLSLPSDLNGLTTAIYDPEASTVEAALGPVCQRIRRASNQAAPADADPPLRSG